MSDARMPTLAVCLQHSTWRHLWAIAVLHDVPRHPRPRKAELVRRLQEHLSHTTLWEELAGELSPEERQAIGFLIAADGGLPRWPFERRFGAIRCYRPWRSDSPRAPWRTPCSAAERLWYLGLIYPWPAKLTPGVMQELIVPGDLLPLLAPFFPPSIATIEAKGETTTSGDLCWDIAALLGLLYSKEICPLHGRWLPPWAQRELNARFSMPEKLGEGRSERKARRLSFVHYLAETAGLIEMAGDYLKPTLLGWQWLETKRHEQYRRLWESWQERTAAAQERWWRFRLPGYKAHSPLAIRDQVLEQLTGHSREEWVSTDNFVSLVELQDAVVAVMLGEEESGGTEVLREMLSGPLTWFGVLIWQEQADNGRANASLFRLSRLGEWLLGQTETAPPEPVVQPCILHEDGTLEIGLPADLRQVVALAGFARYVQGPAAAGVAWFQLTAESVARAVSRGSKALRLADELRVALGGELPTAWLELLHHWAQAAEAFHINRLTVLEAADRKLLQELVSQSQLRDCLHRPLSARMIAIDEGKLPRLLCHLRRQGYWPQVRLSGREQGDNGAGELQGAAGLWLAGQVYAELGRFMRLPAPPPHGILHHLEKELSPAAHSAAETALSKALERLAGVIDGWTPYPAARGAADVERLVARIEQALQEGRDLEMAYWTAGRNERSCRRVTPFWIQRRGKTAYLVGYCHHRQAERVFRIDRIERLRLVSEAGSSSIREGASGN